MIPPITRPHRLEFLDAIRGLAAFYVLFYHARELLFEGFHQGAQPELMALPSRIFTYATISFTFSHQAVVLFFVLSGFVVHLRFARDMQKTPLTAKLNVRQFYFRRIRRLVPALVLAMILTVLIDRAGMAQGYTIYQATTPYPDINQNAYTEHDFFAGVQHLLFGGGLQAWGTNTPLWSVRLEIWIYALYPLLWLLTKRSSQTALFVVSGVYIVGLLLLPAGWVVRNVMLALPLWWMGALLAEIYNRRAPFSLKRVRGLVLLLLVLPLITLSPLAAQLGEPILDIFWALAFMGGIAVLLDQQDRIASWKIWAWLKPLGDFSYTLYVIHNPLFVFMGGWLISQSVDGTLPRYPTWIFVGVTLSLIAAFLLHFIVEKPFIKARPPVTSSASAT